jgi:hypothetical protein
VRVSVPWVCFGRWTTRVRDSFWQSKDFTTEVTENHGHARRDGAGDRSCSRPKCYRFDAGLISTTRRSEEVPCTTVVLSGLRGKNLANRSTNSYVRSGEEIVPPISFLCASVCICGSALTGRDTARSATFLFRTKINGTTDSHRHTQISNYCPVGESLSTGCYRRPQA